MPIPIAEKFSQFGNSGPFKLCAPSCSHILVWALMWACMAVQSNLLGQFSTCGDRLEYNGYSYETRQIGEQCWIVDDMRSPRTRNGDAIPIVLSADEWSDKVLEPARCALERPEGPHIYYNYWAALKVCPSGWHLPSLEEWGQLSSSLGGWDAAGESLKSPMGWPTSPKPGDPSQFNATPSGYRDFKGVWGGQGTAAHYWTGTVEQPLIDSWFVWIEDSTRDLFKFPYFNSMGFSVRCIQSKP